MKSLVWDKIKEIHEEYMYDISNYDSPFLSSTAEIGFKCIEGSLIIIGVVTFPVTVPVLGITELLWRRGNKLHKRRHL